MRSFLLFVSLALAACSSADDDYADYAADTTDSSPSFFEDSYDELADERDPFDEDAAREQVESELADNGYDYSYGCSVDCSGHEAGWQWRAENGYSSDGNSESFEEGGVAFDEALENRVEEMRSEYEAGGEPEY